MTDQNLPPERRLDDESKARMRAELTETIGHEDAARSRVWLAPAVAVAAIVGVAAGGALLMVNGDDRPDHASEIAPAGSGTANDPTQDPTELATSPVPGSSEAATTQTLQADPLTAPGSCAEELAGHLSGATEAARTTYDEGLAILFTKGKRWVLCDDWAATSDGGAPTLIGGRATNDSGAKQTYALSQNYSMSDDSIAQFVAGGPTLPGVESIKYTFPDGHTRDAVIGDDMWLMTYVPTSGPLVDLNSSPTEPVRVEVALADGTTAAYSLQWGQDTCAQINHGC